MHMKRQTAIFILYDSSITHSGVIEPVFDFDLLECFTTTFCTLTLALILSHYCYI